MTWKLQDSAGARGTAAVVMFWLFVALIAAAFLLPSCTTQTDWADIAKQVGRTNP